MNNGIPKNVLNRASDFKFAIKNWNTINDQSNVNYITEVLGSDLCDYNDAYILVIDYIIFIGHNVTQADFKNFTIH